MNEEKNRDRPGDEPAVRRARLVDGGRPGITPKAADAPAGAGRSAVNYPHLVA